ncbi:hypothetical protein AAFC00_005645 [Neodothiora populina]|uniref:glucan 1,3-beta-glucosidase n=1 Tax=Neodothiora populina TaxID=2781224 RepID=A0ABR3PLJ9_9PEZI
MISTLTIVAMFLLCHLVQCATAKGTLGFALGDKKTDGSCKCTSDYVADFKAIQANSGSKLVRIYSASDCNCTAQILPAAASAAFRVVLGVWPDTDAALEADKTALATYVPGYVYAVTVGSETMYRGNFTGPELLSKINSVRGVLPKGTKVGTADSWNKFADGTADALIKGGVDLLLANGFAYWQAQPIANATLTYFEDMQQALGRIQSVSGSLNGIEFWTGETGWPSDGGSDYGAGRASTRNAAPYWTDAICGILT